MRKTVITGLGVMAPTGFSTTEYWERTRAGASAITAISGFPVDGYPIKVAGQLPRTLPGEDTINGRLFPQTDRTTRMALLASGQAIADSGLSLDGRDAFEMGVAVATETGGLEFGQQQLQKLWGEGWESVSAYMSFAWYYAVHTGQVSIGNGLKGPGGVVLSEQSSGLDTLAFGRRQVRKGANVMLCGGVDSMLCPYGLTILSTAQDFSTSADEKRAYRPFSADASGWVIGEGGAVCILEDAEHAQARGRQPYAALSGYAATFDPEPGHRSGSGLRRAVTNALADADVAADTVDAVFADGSGVSLLDRAEANVLLAVFGDRTPVCVPKAGTGRLLAGAGPVDVVAAVLSMRDGVLPPAPSLDHDTIDDRIDVVVGDARPAEVNTAVVVTRSSGGSASAVVLTRA